MPKPTSPTRSLERPFLRGAACTGLAPPVAGATGRSLVLAPATLVGSPIGRSPDDWSKPMSLVGRSTVIGPPSALCVGRSTVAGAAPALCVERSTVGWDGSGRAPVGGDWRAPVGGD